MPTQTYTNKDLGKPLYRDSKTKVYTNKDLKTEHPPDIMDDELDPNHPPDIMDDDIGDVGPKQEERMNVSGDNYKGPDTFWGGVKDSLKPGGDVVQTIKNKGLDSALGYAKGAILDLPENIIGGAKLLSKFTPINAALRSWQQLGGEEQSPSAIDTLRSIPSGLKSMYDSAEQTTQNAYADPESFGRMMGNITGQPLVTEGLVRGVPPAIEGVGKIMKKYQPLSGMIPKIAELRTMRNIEKAIGGKIEKMGQKIRIKTLDGNTVGPIDSPFADAEIQSPLVAGEELPIVKKPATKMDRTKMRSDNPEFINTETGEILDSAGNPIKSSIVKNTEINSKKEWKDPIHKELEDILPKSNILPNTDLILKTPLKQLSDQDLVHLTRLSPALGGTGEKATLAYTELINRGKISGYPAARKYTTHNLNTGEIKEVDRATNRIKTIVNEAPFARDDEFSKMNIQKADFRPDGTIFDPESGNIFNGNGELIGNKSLPTIDKNSPFFRKNRN